MASNAQKVAAVTSTVTAAGLLWLSSTGIPARLLRAVGARATCLECGAPVSPKSLRFNVESPHCSSCWARWHEDNGGHADDGLETMEITSSADVGKLAFGGAPSGRATKVHLQCGFFTRDAGLPATSVSPWKADEFNAWAAAKRLLAGDPTEDQKRRAADLLRGAPRGFDAASSDPLETDIRWLPHHLPVYRRGLGLKKAVLTGVSMGHALRPGVIHILGTSRDSPRPSFVGYQGLEQAFHVWAADLARLLWTHRDTQSPWFAKVQAAVRLLEAGLQTTPSKARFLGRLRETPPGFVLMWHAIRPCCLGSILCYGVRPQVPRSRGAGAARLGSAVYATSDLVTASFYAPFSDILDFPVISRMVVGAFVPAAEVTKNPFGQHAATSPMFPHVVITESVGYQNSADSNLVIHPMDLAGGYVLEPAEIPTFDVPAYHMESMIKSVVSAPPSVASESGRPDQTRAVASRPLPVPAVNTVAVQAFPPDLDTRPVMPRSTGPFPAPLPAGGVGLDATPVEFPATIPNPGRVVPFPILALSAPAEALVPDLAQEGAGEEEGEWGPGEEEGEGEGEGDEPAWGPVGLEVGEAFGAPARFPWPAPVDLRGPLEPYYPATRAFTATGGDQTSLAPPSRASEASALPSSLGSLPPLVPVTPLSGPSPDPVPATEHPHRPMFSDDDDDAAPPDWVPPGAEAADDLPFDQ